MDVLHYAFWFLALEEGGESPSRSGTFTSRYPLEALCMVYRAGLDACEKKKLKFPPPESGHKFSVTCAII